MQNNDKEILNILMSDKEIAEKFENARAFFKDVKVALSLEGRVLSTEEEKAVII